MSKTSKKLHQLSQGGVGDWAEKAGYRLKNRKWLRYSSNIARRALAAIEEIEDMNQKKLAEMLEVSPQHISKMLKGEENLTLETIAKLSGALGKELISFPEYKYSQPVCAQKHFVPSENIVLGAHKYYSAYQYSFAKSRWGSNVSGALIVDSHLYTYKTLVKKEKGTYFGNTEYAMQA